MSKEKHVGDGIYELDGTENRNVMVKITDAEKLKLFKEAGELVGKIGKLEYELECKTNELKPKIKSLREELNSIEKIMHSQKQMKNVACTVQKDYQNKLIYYLYNTDIVDKRILEASDKQIQLNEKPVLKVVKDEKKKEEKKDEGETEAFKKVKTIIRKNKEINEKKTVGQELKEMKKEEKANDDFIKVGNTVFYYPLPESTYIKEEREIQEILERKDDNDFIILKGLPSPVGIKNIGEIK